MRAAGASGFFTRGDGELRTATRAAIAALLGVAVVVPATASAAGTGLDAYEVKTDKADLGRLAEEGFDVTEGRQGNTLEIIATRKQIGELRDLGMRPKLKRNDAGLTARQFAARPSLPTGPTTSTGRTGTTSAPTDDVLRRPRRGGRAAGRRSTRS